MRGLRTAFLTCAAGLVTACAAGDAGDVNSPGLIPTPPDQSLPGSPSGATNPRYPGLKTYSNSANGFFSIVNAGSFQIPAPQTVIGFAAYDSGVYLAIKREDVSALYWIDLYQVSLASSVAAVFKCSIRFDNNLASGLIYDSGSVYISASSWPYSFRRFDAANCTEGTALALPATPSGWLSQSAYSVYLGQVQGVYSQSSIQFVRSYDGASGVLTSVVASPVWNDFKIYFNSDFVRTPRGVWGVTSCMGSSKFCLYLVEQTSGAGRFAPLPDGDYPDFSQSGQGVVMGFRAVSDATGFVAIRYSDRIRIYKCDTASF